MGKPWGQVARAPQRFEKPVLDLLGQVVLELGRQPVRLGPAVAQEVSQEALDDPVPAQYGDGRLPARFGQGDALVRGMAHQAVVGQTLDHGRGSSGGHSENAGQVTTTGPSPGSEVRRQISFKAARCDLVSSLSMFRPAR